MFFDVEGGVVDGATTPSEIAASWSENGGTRPLKVGIRHTAGWDRICLGESGYNCVSVVDTCEAGGAMFVLSALSMVYSAEDFRFVLYRSSVPGSYGPVSSFPQRAAVFDAITDGAREPYENYGQRGRGLQYIGRIVEGRKKKLLDLQEKVANGRHIVSIAELERELYGEVRTNPILLVFDNLNRCAKRFEHGSAFIEFVELISAYGSALGVYALFGGRYDSGVVDTERVFVMDGSPSFSGIDFGAIADNIETATMYVDRGRETERVPEVPTGVSSDVRVVEPEVLADPESSDDSVGGDEE